LKLQGWNGKEPPTTTLSTFTVGVVADTHVPDHARELHPMLIPELKQAHVSVILHAGDISTPSVIRQLEQIAPVMAVRGNRDWAFYRSLPSVRLMEFEGVPLALTHGHGSWLNYLWEKWKFVTNGYDFQRYQSLFGRMLPDAKVIVFGHTHRTENLWRDGQLWFNPGSASVKGHNQRFPSFGLLHFMPGGKVEGEIIDLVGAQLVHQRWQYLNEFS
jgi:putative phosphoesterase